VKRLPRVAVFLSSLFIAGGALAAQGDVAGWYGGVDLMRAYSGLNGANVDQAFANQGITTASTIDTSHTSLGLNLGYRFNQYWSLEAGYTDLGRYSYSAPATAPAVDTIQGNFRAHAWYLAPESLGMLTERWAIFGKAGLTRAAASLDAASASGATSPSGQSASNTGWLLGVGTTYDFSRNLFGKLEADRYGRVGDPNSVGRTSIDTLSVGLGIRF